MDSLSAEPLPALNPQAVSEFHDRFFPQLYRYIRFRTGDSALAEDLASETFVRLLEAMRAGRPPRTSVRGWLMSTASHLIADHFRHVYAHAFEPLPEDVPVPDGDPMMGIDREEERSKIRTAFLSLTPEQQHVLALRFQGGHSVAEAGEIMGKRANAIKALQFRALLALRRALDRLNP